MRDLKPNVVPLLLLILILVLEVLDLDNKVMAQMFDASRQTFPLRHHWFTEGVIHTNGRQLIAVLGVAVIILLAGSFFLPALKPRRREWIFVFVSIVISTVCVSTLKATTGVYCAYELLPYGGDHSVNQLSNLWQGGGACWPGGHVSGPLSLIAIYFAFRAKQPKVALVGLATALLLGTIFGVGQTLRGVHFPSHTLWTLLIVWTINMILVRLFLAASLKANPTFGTNL